MKNAIFIHTANMQHDVWGRPNKGKCQQILDRIVFFIEDSKLYENVDTINIVTVGDPNLKCTLPKVNMIYNGEDITQFEFPTLTLLYEYCKTHPDDNVLYLHDHGVSLGFEHKEGARITQMYKDRLDYHLYWNITKYKESLEHLKDHDTCGAFLVPLNGEVKLDSSNMPRLISVPETPIWHYSNNFWWSTAKHINTLPNPNDYPLILDRRHQPEFWLCSSTKKGKFKCIHSIYESWCYAENFSKELYMTEKERIKFTL